MTVEWGPWGIQAISMTEEWKIHGITMTEEWGP
jgi:hypothetical protein